MKILKEDKLLTIEHIIWWYAFFQKGGAILNDNQIDTIEIKAPRCFSNTRCETITIGYPLASIQWMEELNKYKAELTKEEENKLMSKEQKEILDFIESKIARNWRKNENMI